MSTLLATYGLLEVSIKKDIVYVEYAGNMGANLNNVKVCFDTLYGTNTFEKMLEVCYSIKTLETIDDDPDYLWTAKLRVWNFEKVTGTKVEQQLGLFKHG